MEMNDTDMSFLENAAANHGDVERVAEASDPIPFDPAPRGRAERVDALVLNPSTGDVMEVQNIVYERHPDGRPPARAYWIGRKLRKCIFGVVKECTILKFRNDANIPWEVTPGRAAAKIMSWEKIRQLQHVEDPIKEAAAMHHVCKDGFHQHVMGLFDVLEDEEYLIFFMPFASSGDLFGFVQHAGKFDEPMARYWFKQILSGLTHLQRLGVCHRDMSLENILVDQYKKSVIIDLGMCLRVPYVDHDNGVTDVSGGNMRRLMTPQYPCGKPNYISPEVLKSEEPFDGFAIDLWASAVILFIMLVGIPPWEFAREEDPRYRMVVRGGLTKMLRSWGKEISPAAADLLQRMLREDPRQRLSLIEIQDHAWVTAAEDMESEATTGGSAQDEGWRH